MVSKVLFQDLQPKVWCRRNWTKHKLSLWLYFVCFDIFLFDKVILYGHLVYLMSWHNKNLQFEIEICWKSHNKVIMTVYVQFFFFCIRLYLNFPLCYAHRTASDVCMNYNPNMIANPEHNWCNIWCIICMILYIFSCFPLTKKTPSISVVLSIIYDHSISKWTSKVTQTMVAAGLYTMRTIYITRSWRLGSLARQGARVRHPIKAHHVQCHLSMIK